MTSKKLSTNPVTSMLGFTFKKNIAFTIIVTVISLLIGPARFFREITYRVGPAYLIEDVVKDFSFSNEFPSMAMIFALLSGAFLVFLIIYNFSFLYKKSASDAFHSFPLTRTTLLLCRYVPALVLSLVPLTVGYVGELLVAVGFGIEFDLLYITKSFIFTVIMLLLCGGATLFFAICGGTIFDTIVSVLGISGGIPLIIVIVHALSNEYINGYSTESLYSVLGYTSPYAYAIYSLYTIVGWDYVDPIALRWYSQVICIAAGITLTALAAFLFNRRKSEKAGEPYAFALMPLVIAFIVAFVCGALLGMLFSELEIFSPVFWIFTVIGALLGAVIYGAIARRGFKTVLRSLKIGGAATLAFVLVVVIVITGGLGYETRVPKDSNVAVATVHFSGIELEFKGEDVDLVTKLHTALTKGESTEDYSMRYVQIDYLLKNGSKMSRDYHVTLNSGAQELLTVYKSDVHKKKLLEIADENNHYYHNFTFYSTTAGHIEKVVNDGDINDFLLLYISELDTLTVEDMNKFNKNGFFSEVYLSANNKNGGYVYQNLPLYSCMKKTIAFATSLEDKEIDQAK